MRRLNKYLFFPPKIRACTVDGKADLPASGVLHRSPGLLRGKRIAILQDFNRNAVGRTHERHMAVARRAVDGDAGIRHLLAEIVDILDPIGEVTEIAATGIFFRIPVIGQLQLRHVVVVALFEIGGRGEENQGEPALFILDPADFLQPHQLAVESQRGVDIRYADHGVEIMHRSLSCGLN